MRFDLIHHLGHSELCLLNEIADHLRQQTHQGELIMATLAEIKQALADADAATNEIATDLQDLIDKLATGGLSAAETEEVLTDARALVTRLQGVASTHTP